MMTEEEILTWIEGARDVAEWFGNWPSFHDAEIVDVHLQRVGISSITVHGFRMTQEIDMRGHYVLDRHALVTFTMMNVTDTELLGFNQQNVVSAIVVNKTKNGFRLVLGGCFGLEGWIEARSIAVHYVPGTPANRVSAGYATQEASA